VTALKILLVTMVSMLPLYFWSSGGMQVAHILLVLLIALVVVIDKFRFMVRNEDAVLITLFLFVLFREGYEVFLRSDIRSLWPALYLLFNLLAFNATRRLFFIDEMEKTFVIGLVVAALIAVAGVLFLGYGQVNMSGVRAVGSFNNPNQLGYFSVCLFSLSAIIFLSGRLGAHLFLLLVVISLFLSTASLSKSAMISIVFGVLFSGFLFWGKVKGFFLGVVILVVVLITGAVLLLSGKLDDYSFVTRLQGIGSQSDDSFEGRGYGVIVDELTTSSLLFGRGSVHIGELVGHEIHSTLFSFFGNYGLVGGLLFAGFLFLWAGCVYREYGLVGVFVVVAPPMLYGIAHNGSRFTIFWILLALSFSRLPGKDLGRFPGACSLKGG